MKQNHLFLFHFIRKKSGRRDSNSRMLAWEANALPLGYSRLNGLQRNFTTNFFRKKLIRIHLILFYPSKFRELSDRSLMGGYHLLFESEALPLHLHKNRQFFYN